MKDVMILKSSIRAIKSKWKFILLVSIIVALIFGIYKNYFSSFYVTSGDILITRTLKIENYEDKNDFLNLEKYITSDTFYMKLYNDSRESIDYDSAFPLWKEKTGREQILWLRDHIHFSYFGDGYMELSLNFPESTLKSVNLKQEQLNKLVEANIESIKSIDSKNHIVVLDKVDIYPKQVELNKSSILFKYILIGFILGALGSCTIILLWEMRKKDD